MATTKTRIYISLSDDVKRALFALAKRDGVTRATKVVELLRDALEVDEDRVSDRVASARDNGKTKFVSHNLA